MEFAEVVFLFSGGEECGGDFFFLLKFKSTESLNSKGVEISPAGELLLDLTPKSQAGRHRLPIIESLVRLCRDLRAATLQVDH